MLHELDDWLLTELTIIQKNAFLSEATLSESGLDDLFNRYTIQYANILWKNVQSVEAQAHNRILTILSNECRNGT